MTHTGGICAEGWSLSIGAYGMMGSLGLWGIVMVVAIEAIDCSRDKEYGADRMEAVKSYGC